ncbi:391R [Invertebrate iridescent virus Kaz2018]|uniref:Uncharacterized protein 391R n=1 Tax=Invertebrate iridescent virus 6 TaxID=176652 RepID=VF391_IIV6|nr:391R [Invertebrate iridescent virus 6]Q91FD3.1 RecName: Full=Uncharacterized protein 391R [Invertebrate iridescent virus 6]AAK82251.1 391R [Invertebrate iridescent virus 6]QMS79412.1 hypothetical protein IIV6-T1_385 [Invertebrate iridescent virus 6]QNH08801.1 391R [Invertebrate iridescent virus Kaz2018]
MFIVKNLNFNFLNVISNFLPNKMLENVFIELYERGILLFLDVDSYCKNSDDADLNILKGRKEFLKYFDEPLEKGYVFTFNTDIHKLYKEIEEESCAVISYGYESDTDDKADDVGRNFVEILNKNGYITDWTEEVKDSKTIKIVIDENDIPNFKLNESPYLLNLTNDDLFENKNPLIQLIEDEPFPTTKNHNNDKRETNDKDDQQLKLNKMKEIEEKTIAFIDKNSLTKSQIEEYCTQQIINLDAIDTTDEIVKCRRKETIQNLQQVSLPTLKCSKCLKLYKQKKSYEKHIEKCN